MSQRPPQDPRPTPRTSRLEETVADTLRIGQHYADLFAKLVKLAATIQYMQVSNLDSTPLVTQLRSVAEEARANLELELDRLRERCNGWISQPETLSAAEDGIEPCAFALSITTRH
ncbi:hypothetical protein R75461_08044 [Paraburkholderia nemoris]|uniref:hypothetical protein n=1 Tax=Paraburkholderia nemoris TaxID=2793076 RepID=UPI00190ADD50|nr:MULTISPECIES: hypothetical protein [Paraburkholderia]MBK3787004.1 hypothetical protein [Paraburkholderia aspalathi]CAE6862241.1 hypothetical protein R75461_08044 [Paraburkholderia nemoris]